MANYTLTITGRGQKLTHETTSTTEDTYTVVAPAPDAGAGPFYIQMIATTAGIFYHTTAGSSQADGFPIAAGTPFSIPVGNGSVFYLSAQVGTGRVDFVVI